MVFVVVSSGVLLELLARWVYLVGSLYVSPRTEVVWVEKDEGYE